MRRIIDDETEALIAELIEARESARQIAKKTGVSRTAVQTRIDERREAEVELLDDLDDDERAALADPADPADYVPVPPFTFVGVVPRDGLTAVDDWRYVDSASVPTSSNGVYQCVQALQNADRWAEAAEIEADLERQYEAAAEREDLIKVDHGGNLFVWRRRGEVLS